ncbi:MAG TPA: diguanylate cyclase, partial [Solirubrobacteraceae bacterium]|nr:diguanylate cyclase [Solirubrobacteraceae bacterium]
MWARLQRLEHAAVGDDRRLAALLQTVLLLVGGLATPLMIAVPGAMPGGTHESWALALSLVVLVYAVASLRFPWERLPAATLHAAALLSLPTVVLAAAWTGGHASPIRLLVSLTVVWAACYCRPAVTAGYVVLCTLTFAAPYLYAADPVPPLALAREQIVVAFGLGAIGLTVALLRRALDRALCRAAEATEEQRALLRVATAVADDVPSEELHTLVATEVGRVFGGDAGAIVRLDADGGQIMGSWSDGMPQHPPGMRFAIPETGLVTAAIRAGAPARGSVSAGTLAETVSQLGYRETIVAPVLLDHRAWGIISVTAAREGSLGPAVGARLMDFGALIATAVANTEARERLAAQAFSDPLTGLANHRAFHERLAGELSRAQARGRALSLVLLDVDAFKAVNDGAGHEHGDRVLADLAER